MSSDGSAHFAAPDNPFRLLLFADQSLDRLPAGDAFPLESPAGDALQRLRQAQALRDEGKLDAARQSLITILDLAPLQTRPLLWTWAALRELGVAPERSGQHRVHGVVLEVPMHAGVDTVAVYADGSGCYINYTGLEPIVWEASQPPMSEYVAQIIEIVQPLTQTMTSVTDHPQPPRTGVYVSALTCTGTLRAEIPNGDFIEGISPFSPLYAAGGDLIDFIVSRVREDKRREAE